MKELLLDTWLFWLILASLSVIAWRWLRYVRLRVMEHDERQQNKIARAWYYGGSINRD